MNFHFLQPFPFRRPSPPQRGVPTLSRYSLINRHVYSTKMASTKYVCSHTLVNSLAIVSGIICDGAKPSCAAKIASSVQAGIMGYHMYQNGQQFRGGDGIVTKGVENTIRNVSQLGREGMRETDKEIVKIMLQES